MSRLDAYMEAERRGILPPDKAALLAEARKRGLAPPGHGQSAAQVEVRPFHALRAIPGDMARRERNIQDIRQRSEAGKTGRISGGIQEAGQAAGAGLDIMGRVASQLTPDIIGKAGVNALQSGIGALAKTPTGSRTVPTLGDFGALAKEDYANVKKKYPDAVGNAEALANIGMLLAPARAPKAAKPTIIGKAGAALKSAGQKQSKSFIDDLVLPKMTPATESERQAYGLVSQSFLGKRKHALDDIEREAARHIAGIKGVSKIKTVSANERIVREEAVRVSKNLMSSLEKSKTAISNSDALDHVMNTAVRNIEKNPMITNASGASETARKLVDQFVDILEKSDNTAAGLMKARQEFDRVAKKYRSGVFDSSSESAYTITTKEIRNSINDLVASRVPDAAVREELRKSHALFTAADNMAEKVPASARNALERIVLTVENKMPGKSELAKFVALGGGAFLAPGLVFTAGGAYVAGKAIGSAATKKMLGNALLATDAAIVQVKDKAILEQLRADRAALSGYLSSLPEKEETE